MTAIIEYFEQFKEFGIFIISMIPIIELRGAIPAGIALGINPAIVYPICVIANMLPIPFILAFIRPIFNWLKKWKAFSFIKKIEDRALNKSEKIQKRSFLGLMIFVAIPFPGTGGWTGALIAALLNMRMKKALPAIFFGILISGALVLTVTLILKYGVVESGALKSILEFLK